ncbi:hypothetical protein ACYSNO_01900 [Enterococcus sp. LJL98]
MFISLKKMSEKNGFYRLWLIILAFFFVLPQYLTKSMIVGSDIIFHFNRFYDVSQQIEQHNFQYFMNQYGFQQSGRIVNALYGPLMAYIHGGLVWLSSSWFVYQMLANFLLFVLAGNCMYFLLKKCTIKKQKAFYLSVLYMTSFSIIYWVSRQGFTSWGAAVFPLCLVPIVDLFEEERFPPIKVGFLMALIFQIHLFSSVLLLIVYFVCYGFLFFKKPQVRKQLLIQGILSVGLFFTLTLNVWYGFWTLYRGNELLSPFVNRSMYKNTTTFRSVYWLVTPVALFPLLLFYLRKICKDWKQLADFDRAIASVGLVFLILSTNLVPWKFLAGKNWTIIETIQFPFRFFVPFTVLLLVFIGRNGRLVLKRQDWTLSFLRMMTFLAVIQLSVTTLSAYHQWQTAEKPVRASRHTHLFSESRDEMTSSFFQTDKSKTLALIQKSTPDYLPIYQENGLNKYNQYKVLVIDQNESEKFTKEVVDGKLIVSWEATAGEEVHLPVVVYERTKVVYNQKEREHQELNLTDIGTPILLSEAGVNQLELSDPSSRVLLICIFIPFLTLLGISSFSLVRKSKK